MNREEGKVISIYTHKKSNYLNKDMSDIIKTINKNTPKMDEKAKKMIKKYIPICKKEIYFLNSVVNSLLDRQDNREVKYTNLLIFPNQSKAA